MFKVVTVLATMPTSELFDKLTVLANTNCQSRSSLLKAPVPLSFCVPPWASLRLLQVMTRTHERRMRFLEHRKVRDTGIYIERVVQQQHQRQMAHLEEVQKTLLRTRLARACGAGTCGRWSGRSVGVLADIHGARRPLQPI